ncbi:MAG: S8 family peptidase [Chloroflexota bacterium]|nr:S8 family peptidase [Chloroflexota bacterium]
MSDSLLSMLAAASPDKPVPVIIRYKNLDAMARANADHAGQAADIELGYQYSLLPAQRASGTPEKIAALAESPHIATIWPDLPVHTMLDVSVPLIRTPELWNLGVDGSGVRVAVVDTGIDPDHPDLQGRIAAVKDFTKADGDARDGNGHGTHVAGTIAGSGEASDGTYKGVAPQAELLVAKVLRDNGSGMTSDVMAGVEWAVFEDAQVINLSLGSSINCDGSDALSTLCDEAVAQGVVVCAAAGNAGPFPGTVGSPGCARRVITIGATDDDDQITGFSSRGPTRDGRIKPDICFPGNAIVAARAEGTSMGEPVNAYYTTGSGTSMATPHAAGAAALLLQAFPDLTPDEVKRQLMQSAVDLGLDANTQGSGRGDLLAAYLVQGPPLPIPTDPPSPPEPGGCLGFGSTSSAASRTSADGGRVPMEFWVILAVLLMLCACVTFVAAALVAIGLTY